jgi:hypothetical protein
MITKAENNSSKNKAKATKLRRGIRRRKQI